MMVPPPQTEENRMTELKLTDSAGTGHVLKVDRAFAEEGEVFVRILDPDAGGIGAYVDGIALRNALLEAFPIIVPLVVLIDEDIDEDEGRADLVSILDAADEYAAPRAARAHAQAVLDFVTALHPTPEGPGL